MAQHTSADRIRARGCRRGSSDRRGSTVAQRRRRTVDVEITFARRGAQGSAGCAPIRGATIDAGLPRASRRAAALSAAWRPFLAPGIGSTSSFSIGQRSATCAGLGPWGSSISRSSATTGEIASRTVPRKQGKKRRNPRAEPCRELAGERAAGQRQVGDKGDPQLRGRRRGRRPPPDAGQGASTRPGSRQRDPALGEHRGGRGASVGRAVAHADRPDLAPLDGIGHQVHHPRNRHPAGGKVMHDIDRRSSDVEREARRSSDRGDHERGENGLGGNVGGDQDVRASATALAERRSEATALYSRGGVEQGHAGTHGGLRAPVAPRRSRGARHR